MFDPTHEFRNVLKTTEVVTEFVLGLTEATRKRTLPKMRDLPFADRNSFISGHMISF